MVHFEQTKQLLNNSSLFYIISTNMEGNYSYVNDHYAAQFGYIDGDFVGKPFHITMHPGDLDTCKEVAEKCFLNPGNLYPATIRKHDGKGGYVYTQWEYKAMFDNEGQPYGIFCLGYNISTYVAESAMLRTANHEVSKIEQAMDQIIFDHAHLIRAPLSNIIGLTSHIDTSTMERNNANIIKMIQTSAHQLDSAVHQIVNLGRKNDLSGMGMNEV